MKIFDRFTASMAWIQIVASPFIAGLIAGFFFYINYPTTTGLIISISIAMFSLIIGIAIANKITKKRGAVDVISRIPASPELDDIDRT